MKGREMQPSQKVVRCPVALERPFTPCDPAELAPLLERLRSKEAVTTRAVFPRGTLVEDGRLDLCKQQIGPRGAAAVAEALGGRADVHAVLLGADGIGDEGATAVAGLLRPGGAVRTAYLGCNGIGPAGVAALTRAVDGGAPLSGLWLKRNPVGDEGARQLAAMLERNATLRTLDLVNTELGPGGVRVLCRALARSNRTLRRLYLGGNAIGADDAAELAEVVRHNPVIECLFLNANRLGDAGCAALADALRENRSLRCLGLASNDIGPAGAGALFAALAEHPTLRQLDLGYAASAPAVGALPNHVGDGGASAAADMLRRNRVPEELDLTRNGLSIAGVTAIVEALEANPSLVRLSVGTAMPPALVRRLRAALRRRDSVPPRQQDAEVRAVKSVYRS
jgi:Ran GTPase-activating protein (RanGAP) involved in mRNA processing and transport